MNNRERWMTSNDPAWMLSALGDAADERRCKILVEECRKKWDGPLKRNWNQNVFRWKVVAKSNWINQAIDDRTNEWMSHLMRCIWPSPFIERERVECEKCLGSSMVWNRINERCDCDNGHTLAPLIKPRWRTPLVVNLARQVRGREAGWCCGNCGRECGTAGFWCFCGNAATRYKSEATPPNPELMPILSDALMDAGCDVPEIIEHLKCGVHVDGECWVIGMLLDAGRESTITPSR